MHRAVLFTAPGLLQAASQDVPCLQLGIGYNDPKRNLTVTRTASSPAACQERCQRTLFCDVFTWYNDTQGCWLQGSLSALTIADANAVSGPRACTAMVPGTIETPRQTDSNSKYLWIWLSVGAIIIVLLLVVCIVGLCCRQGADKVYSEFGGGSRQLNAALSSGGFFHTENDEEASKRAAQVEEEFAHALLMAESRQLAAQQAPKSERSCCIPLPFSSGSHATPMSLKTAVPVQRPSRDHDV
eukprot:TRINITY_DN51137_c0_g1_i1.p1 TRINITY_DN51137_c0_g1~~TRINITY_DN51137_c0_g1_i1.p1  ORF type:complete len:242 (-),score=39.96 TRINITY_DN51137_c0_g1_i1:100-825(-)